MEAGNQLVPTAPIRSASEPILCTRVDSSGSGSGRWKRVVVVGGGISGSIVAKYLQYHADVVLIDQKEYFEIPWATMRTTVEPAIADKAVINHADYLVNGNLVVASAVGVTETEVVTSDGGRVGYDYLVVATGHSYSSPGCRRERIEEFREANLKMRSSSSVLIIGGGPSGVELASDIASNYPEKKVTLVHSGSRLLGFIGCKAGNKALEWLRSKNVDVLLEQTIDLNSLPDSNGIYITSAGEAIAADVHFVCVNNPLGSSWLQESVLSDRLDKRGQLMVDEHLRVKGRSNIFAVGDIVDIHERKQGILAQRHAAIVAKNLKAMLKGELAGKEGKEVKLGKYKPSVAIAMVSLGKKDAVAQLPFTTMSGFLPGLIKTREVFLRKTRKLLSV
ncbi:apoptosis-inducing factor homolog B-like [Zingiber officinale]|uniref:apoptosis-inducing factor homolog B-like n=1 Tax=Zingiber officinale TaxID=94328 RepID=UPI001C4AB10B|nr:apoptosis-inducing factor homolog B-like [Zingiber officinale]